VSQEKSLVAEVIGDAETPQEAPIPAYDRPSWDEVRAAIEGSPVEIYIMEGLKCGDIPQPFLLLDGIGLGCLKLACVERKFGVQGQTQDTGRAFNCYLMKVGDSGSGKGFASDNFLHACKAEGIHILRGRSEAAIANHCKGTERHAVPVHAPFGLYRVSEIKTLLSAKDPVAKGLATAFLTAYDAGELEWTVAPRGQFKELLIPNFHPSMLVDAQPDLIEASYGSTNLESGLLARFLVAFATYAAGDRMHELDVNAIRKAYACYGIGQNSDRLIVRPELPESKRVAAYNPSGATKSAWQRLRGDYLTRIAALLDPAGTDRGRIDPSAMDRALVIVEWFLGETILLQGLVHGSEDAMLISRFEREVMANPGVSRRDLLRMLRINVRRFAIVADTAEERGSVRSENLPNRQQRWYPTGESGKLSQVVTKIRDNLDQAGVSKSGLSQGAGERGYGDNPDTPLPERCDKLQVPVTPTISCHEKPVTTCVTTCGTPTETWEDIDNYILSLGGTVEGIP
jgi:hypothetical protein